MSPRSGAPFASRRRPISRRRLLRGSAVAMALPFRNSISLDQLVAERIGTLTRFPSLTLAVNGGRSLSWTRSGVAIPPEGRASRVFNQLFLQGTPAEVERQVREIDAGRSILDVIS